jgi:hypothetical protein
MRRYGRQQWASICGRVGRERGSGRRGRRERLIEIGLGGGPFKRPGHLAALSSTSPVFPWVSTSMILSSRSKVLTYPYVHSPSAPSHPLPSHRVRLWLCRHMHDLGPPQAPLVSLLVGRRMGFFLLTLVPHISSSTTIPRIYILLV